MKWDRVTSVQLSDGDNGRTNPVDDINRETRRCLKCEDVERFGSVIIRYFDL
jgi:hypothetical protein